MDSWEGIAPVGSLRPNPFGLYDMGGNIPELTCSKYTEAGYIGEEIKCLVSSENPNIIMVVRGGSWNSYPESMRSARRSGKMMDQYAFSLHRGFRLVRESSPVKVTKLFLVPTL